MNAGQTRKVPGNGAALMKWPLVGSAAGHLALLAFLLLLRAGAGPSFPGMVQVILVEGIRTNGLAGEKSDARLPVNAMQSPTTHVDQGPVLSPPSVPGTSLTPPIASEDGGAPPVPALLTAFSPPAHPGSGEKINSMPSGPSGGARKVSVSAPGVSGGNGGGDGQETRLLRERIESRIVYPEDAIRRGQEGEVLLRIRVGEGGIPGEIRIARSSGARVLDDAARNGVVRAAPLPSLPGWFDVPVRFLLR